MRSLLVPLLAANGDDEDCAPPKVTDHYLELEIPLEADIAMVLYYIPRNDDSIFVATCWDNTFDNFLRYLDELSDSTTQDGRWPVLLGLLTNGRRDDYDQGALIKLTDPDDGRQKWFLATVVCKLQLEDAFSMFGDRTRAASEMVIAKSLELLAEMEGFTFQNPQF